VCIRLQELDLVQELDNDTCLEMSTIEVGVFPYVCDLASVHRLAGVGSSARMTHT
jgi:hypothetical protein